MIPPTIAIMTTTTTERGTSIAIAARSRMMPPCAPAPIDVVDESTSQQQPTKDLRATHEQDDSEHHCHAASEHRPFVFLPGPLDCLDLWLDSGLTTASTHADSRLSHFIAKRVSAGRTRVGVVGDLVSAF